MGSAEPARTGHYAVSVYSHMHVASKSSSLWPLQYFTLHCVCVVIDEDRGSTKNTYMLMLVPANLASVYIHTWSPSLLFPKTYTCWSNTNRRTLLPSCRAVAIVPVHTASEESRILANVRLELVKNLFCLQRERPEMIVTADESALVTYSRLARILI